jgi:cell division cycle protein 20 (cofactor of APC complex)
MDLDVANLEINAFATAENEQTERSAVAASPAKEEYKKALAASLGTLAAGNRVLAFTPRKAKHRPTEAAQSSLRALYTQNREAVMRPKRYSRHVPQAPERILDAPELLDDFYLNLLDWNEQNMLGVALGREIYLWNAQDGAIQNLMQTADERSHVTSLAWVQEGNYMAVGTSDAKVQIWDAASLKMIRNMDGHSARVASLTWNGPVLSSGGRDSLIVHHDVRAMDHKV